MFVQATLGTILARQEDVELGDMHALYGFSAIVAVMIMYGYRTSPFLKGKELILYGLGSLFVMGLGQIRLGTSTKPRAGLGVTRQKPSQAFA